MTKQKIKFYEVINWLFTSGEIPQVFKDNVSQLKSIVPYITEQFWRKPKLIAYLNKYTNDLHSIPDPIDQLELLKKLIRIQGLTKRDLWSFVPQRGPNLLKEIQERDNLDEGNARAKLMLARAMSIDLASYVKVAPTKKNVNLKDEQAKKRVEEAIAVEKIRDQIKKEESFKNDSRFLKELNQNIIDEMELVLFDVSLLKKANMVLLIFIDKENQKKYYRVPFQAQFYISKKDGVINNDYIEGLNEDFIRYAITDIKLFTKLKFMLNNSYKRIVNAV